MTIEEIKKLLTSKTTNIAKLEAAAAVIPKMRDDVTAAIADLALERRRMMLTGTDAQIDAANVKSKDLGREVERLDVLADEIENRLTVARDTALEAEVEAKRIAALQLRDAAVERIKGYPDLARQMRDLLRTVAEADIAVDGFNRFAQASGVDVDLLTGPEDAARERPLLARQIISSEIVERWVFVESGNRVPGADIEQKITFDKIGRKWVYLPMPHGFASEVVKRKFRIDTVLAAHSFGRVEPLASTLTLPGLVVGDRPLWKPIERVTPDEIIGALETFASTLPALHVDRRTDVIWTVIEDESAADEPAADNAA